MCAPVAATLALFREVDKSLSGGDKPDGYARDSSSVLVSVNYV